jgi:hypothetical protein
VLRLLNRQLRVPGEPHDPVAGELQVTIANAPQLLYLQLPDTRLTDHSTLICCHVPADACAAMDLALFEQQKGPTLELDAPQLQVIHTHPAMHAATLPAPPARCWHRR